MNPRSGGARSVTTLRPIESRRETAIELARRAIRSRSPPTPEMDLFLSGIERDVANGSASGVLRFEGEEAVGLALWDRSSPLGATVEVLFLVEGQQTPDAYRQFYAEVSGAAGPIAFTPGRLAGLTDLEEEDVMRALRFRRFSRTEMQYPPNLPSPEPAGTTPDPLRTTRANDRPALARLYERAYRDTFDRNLFLLDTDPKRDAEGQVGGVVDGRWGEFFPWASPVVDEGAELVAATLVVGAPYGALLAHVMVDPDRRRRGLGRAVVAAAIRSLRARQVPAIVLNVTNDNAPAVELYQRMGFVESVAPSHGWYSSVRVPTSPSSR
ncbi:MAG: GNAT family N-acetyltransferase [Thermoplasmata archaeon]